MSGYPPWDPRIAASPFAIGDPGRTARERQAGPPGNRAGLPDAELSAAVLPGLVMRAATVRGLQHRALGEPRQDAFAIGHRAVAGQKVLAIAVVCDGVGSLDRSENAAILVSRCLVRLGADGTGWPESFKRANEALCEIAESVTAAASGDHEAVGMATTAVALSVCREGGDWVGEVAWVGDSPVWHLSDDGRWSRLTDAVADEDEFHSSAVTPLPSADGACSVKQFRSSGGALFVMSDGVANPLAWSPDVQEALADWWASPPDPFTFAAQVGFARRTHIDDRTVIGIWPEPGAGESAAPLVRERDLGPLAALGEGRLGSVYRVSYLLPGDPTPLAYKQFIADAARQARSAQAAVAFRAGMSPADRAELDQFCAWPRQVVRDEVGGIRGLLMPLIPAKFFCRLADSDSGAMASRPRPMTWLISSAEQRAAASLDLGEVGRTDRLILLAQLTGAIRLLHEHGWVFGDLSFGNASFRLGPARLMLLDCDGAAPLADLTRQQSSTPFWDPPECPIQPRPGQPRRQELLDDRTDVYKLGLAILRCLTPGKGAVSSRDIGRLGSELDAEGTALVARALSADRGDRPTAGDLYDYLAKAISDHGAGPRQDATVLPSDSPLAPDGDSW